MRKNLDQVEPLLRKLPSPQAASILERAKQPLPTLEDLVSDKEEEESEAITLNVSGLDNGKIRLNGQESCPTGPGVPLAQGRCFTLSWTASRSPKMRLPWPSGQISHRQRSTVISMQLFGEYAKPWAVRASLSSRRALTSSPPDAQIYFDVDEVESLLADLDKLDSPVERRTAMRRVAELYQTDFLEDIDMPWADDRRFELQNRFRQILGELGEDYFEKRNLQTALEIYQRAIEYDPFQDEYHLTHYADPCALGDKSSTRKHYKQYRDPEGRNGDGARSCPDGIHPGIGLNELT